MTWVGAHQPPSQAPLPEQPQGAQGWLSLRRNSRLFCQLADSLAVPDSWEEEGLGHRLTDSLAKPGVSSHQTPGQGQGTGDTKLKG